MKIIDLTGKTFERLTVVERAENTAQGQARWHCKCVCGNEVVLKSIILRRGISKSCGCYQRDSTIARHTKHGHGSKDYSSPTYSSWCAMNNRCENPNNKKFPDYGGRGIAVCDRWKSFENFLSDMREKPKGKTLDRIDVNGNYEPENCRWATPKQQSRNKRNNVHLTIDETTRTTAEWSEISGIHRSTIDTRLRAGWKPKRAVFEPPRRAS